MYTGGEIAGEVIETGEGVKMLSKVTIVELLSTEDRRTDRVRQLDRTDRPFQYS